MKKIWVVTWMGYDLSEHFSLHSTENLAKKKENELRKKEMGFITIDEVEVDEETD